jgi:hypothetical protein
MFSMTTKHMEPRISFVTIQEMPQTKVCWITERGGESVIA